MDDFTSAPDRSGTNAEKYTLRKELFHTEDVLPAWVADMDIKTPDFVLESVKERLKHPILGYEHIPRSAFEAQQQWMQKRHGVDYDIEDMLYSHSVVASLHVTIEAFSEIGDEVIVQTPIYPPFLNSVKSLGRKVLHNPLKIDAAGRYRMDLNDLKKKITKKTKLLLLCSPHNPTGRVWSQQELQELFAICKRYDIVVFSDEIHSDLVYDGYKHLPSALFEDVNQRLVTAIGVGKTFNMAGFAISTVVVAKALRKRFDKAYDRIHFAQGSVLSHVAYEAAYKNGATWVDALRKHLRKNYEMLCEVCVKYPHLLHVTPIEATYLAWLDCRGMQLNNKELREFFVYKCKLGLTPGISFGSPGNGFMRLNFGVASDTMAQIVKNLENGLKGFKKDGN